MKKVSLFFVIFIALAFSGYSILNNNQVKIENEGLKNQVSDLQQQIVTLKQETAKIFDVATSAPVVQTNDFPVKNELTPSEDRLATAQTMSGDNLGYITKIYNKDGNKYLTIDYVQWLQGKDAAVAAVEDGNCEIEGRTKIQALAEVEVTDFSMGWGQFSDCAPDGYYIRNINPMLRNFKISGNADIEIRDNGSLQKISLEKLTPIIESYNNKESGLFIITLKDDIVIKIQEAYRP
jgi:hypothetical protein